MRIALISDVHATLVALDAVLADIDRRGVEQIVCLGDVPMFGPQPHEAMVRLRELGCPCVMGNHDDELLDLERLHENADPSPWLKWIDWCAGQLSEADLTYLRSFQPLIEISLGPGANLLCYHGSPRSNEDFIFATTPESDLEEMLHGHTATVMVGGHTHIPMLRRFRDLMVVTVGAVGWPLERMPFTGHPRFLPWAEYAIVGYMDGLLDIDLCRVPFDVGASNQVAFDRDMPGVAEWVEGWVEPCQLS